MARRDRAGDGRWPGHERDHEANGQIEALRWRWQERYVEEGVDGLLRDKTRPPGKKPVSAAVKRVLTKTANETPSTRRTGAGVDGNGDGDQPVERAAHLG